MVLLADSAYSGRPSQITIVPGAIPEGVVVSTRRDALSSHRIGVLPALEGAYPLQSVVVILSSPSVSFGMSFDLRRDDCFFLNGFLTPMPSCAPKRKPKWIGSDRPVRILRIVDRS